jgi:hypothetical protein
MSQLPRKRLLPFPLAAGTWLSTARSPIGNDWTVTIDFSAKVWRLKEIAQIKKRRDRAKF